MTLPAESYDGVHRLLARQATGGSRQAEGFRRRDAVAFPYFSGRKPMQARKFSVGVGVAAAAMSVMTLMPGVAFADYGPSGNDVVGVGSDTLQAGVDFIADGDALGDAGFNTGQFNKFISIDATADANTRLAYSTAGANGAACAPGTGPSAGTGNGNSTHSEGTSPCTLNPTVLLRAGLSPIQRPNGSGAGYNLLKADTNTTTGKSINNLVDFARASSARGSNALFDSLQMGNDPLGMLTSTTSNAQKTLSVAQIKSIYNCTVTDWGSVGGAAGNTIKPLIPQVGSGTRSYFLGQIGLTEGTLGSCVTAVEENDPEAIDASSSPANAIEPMSQSRLYLFQGKLSDGTSNGVGPYFKDPSCAGLVTTPSACVAPTNSLAPNVKLWTSADPAPSDAGAAFYPTRPLYIYFRHADLSSAKAFQPGSTLNWVRTMLYNPGGATPYLCTAAGQALISAAGIIPACTYTASGP
jgi:ABC-type phosphate transport system substrate-binding protein